MIVAKRAVAGAMAGGGSGGGGKEPMPPVEAEIAAKNPQLPPVEEPIPLKLKWQRERHKQDTVPAINLNRLTFRPAFQVQDLAML